MLKTGETIRARTCVWTAGVKPHPVVAKLGLPLDAASGKDAGTGGHVITSCDGRKLLSDRCGGCHNERSPQSGLDLQSQGVEARITGTVAQGCGEVLADPQNPTESGSLIVAKISGTATCGERMPAAPLAMLDAEEIACVRDFISGLKPPSASGSCKPREERACDLPLGVKPDWFTNAGAGAPCTLAVQACSADGELWMPEVCELGDYGWPRGGTECGADKDWNCDGTVQSACSKQWHMALSAPGTQWVNGVGVDGESNTYVVGEFSNYTDFGTGLLGSDEPGGQFKNDVFLAKYDEFGAPVWAKQFGDTSNQYGSQLAVDAETGDVAMLVRLFGSIDFGGGSPTYQQKGSSDFVVALFDTDGKYTWSQQFGGKAKDRAERVVFSRLDGDVIVGGQAGAADGDQLVIPTMGSITPKGLQDGLVVKMDRMTGGVKWYYVLGGREVVDGDGNVFDDDYVFGVDTDAAGDVYVTGRFEGYFDFPNLDQTSGTTEVESAGAQDIFVVKLEGATGNPIWSKHFGGAGDDRAYDLALQPGTGNILVLGYFSGTVDFGVAEGLSAKGGESDDDIFVLSLKADDGSTVFAEGYGNSISQFGVSQELGKTTRVISLQVDGSDNIYVGGTLYGSFDGRITATDSDESKPDAFFVKLSPTGVYQSGRIYGGVGSEFAQGIALDANNGTIAIGGRFYGSSFDTGMGRLMGVSDDADGFVLKINQP